MAKQSIKQLTSSTVVNSCKTVFYLEGWLLLVTGCIMLFFPTKSIEMFGIQADARLASYFFQQFAVMCLLMGFVGVRSHPTVATTTLQACLFADFLYIIVFVPLISEYGSWTPGSIFSVGITALLAIVRISYLIVVKEEKGGKIRIN